MDKSEKRGTTYPEAYIPMPKRAITNTPTPDELLEPVYYGIDEGSPSGDETALSIKRDNKLFTFVGDEARAILALLTQTRNKTLEEVLALEHMQIEVPYTRSKSSSRHARNKLRSEKLVPAIKALMGEES